MLVRGFDASGRCELDRYPHANGKPASRALESSLRLYALKGAFPEDRDTSVWDRTLSDRYMAVQFGRVPEACLELLRLQGLQIPISSVDSPPPQLVSNGDRGPGWRKFTAIHRISVHTNGTSRKSEEVYYYLLSDKGPAIEQFSLFEDSRVISIADLRRGLEWVLRTRIIHE